MSYPEREGGKPKVNEHSEGVQKVVLLEELFS